MDSERSEHRRLRHRIRRAHNAIPPWAHSAFRFFILAGIACAGVFTAWAIFASVPAVDTIRNRVVGESTKIYDRTGDVLLYDVHGSMRRTEVPLEEISPYIRNATVAIEDDSFYQHFGFRPLSFMRAILANISSVGFSQGGSTITQQVVKNTLLTQDKTIIRKAKEIILAMKLERIATKDQILNIYLNETSYGGTIYGAEEATMYFFGKPAKEVSLAEAAYLSALPQAPTRYSPYGNHKDELEARKNLVLSRMKELGYITEDEYASARAEQVQFREEKEAGIKAPHFVFFIREYLENKYGADAVANEGLKVITTLDYDLQQKAEEIVRARALENEKNFNAENAGIVAIDPRTGHILAMVGSRGYFDEEIDGKVNITLAKRQPGSSFKPFVYATAFKKGYTPETMVFDVQTQFSTACSAAEVTNSEPPCYSPVNYDAVYRGPVSLRNALAQSLNIPAVKTLYLTGIPDAIETARDMGISTLVDASRYGLTLVLGGGEVTLLEMTSAYGVFANDGIRNPATGVLSVEDSRGNLLEQYEKAESRVLDPQVARLVNDVLSDNEARTPAFGANSALYFPGFNVAAKTGTTNDYVDAWIVGYTPGLAVGAWAGNNDATSMEKRVAGLIIAPLWHEFVEIALEKYPSDDFVSPSPDPEYDSLPSVLRGNWNTDPSRGLHDILYWVNKDTPRAGAPDFSDSQFSRWEYAVSLWASQSFGSSTSSTPIPSGFSISSPAQGAQLSLGTPFDAAVSFPLTMGIRSVTYFLNGTFVGVSAQPPYVIAVQPAAAGAQTLRAVADTQLGQIENQVTFSVQ
ncbi:MAG: penicillin-binding protein [Minisyncoccia bacterium]